MTKIIWEGGQIRPCLTGAGLGQATVGLEELRGRARSEYRRVSSARGCSSCPARRRCARCLFPHPFNPRQYCEIVRRFPEVGRLVLWTNLRNVIVFRLTARGRRYPGTMTEIATKIVQADDAAALAGCLGPGGDPVGRC